MQHGKETVIGLVRTGPVLPALLSVALSVPILLVPVMADRPMTSVDWALSLGGGLLLVAFGAGIYLWPMLDRKPRLILSPEGLRAPRKTDVLVPWDKVTSVHYRPKRGKRAALVSFVVEDFTIPPRGAGAAPSGQRGFGGTLTFWPEWLDGGWWRIREAIKQLAPTVEVLE